jgi:pSer/pThr/pTyr-binding forkhead associated (FHA) protein
VAIEPRQTVHVDETTALGWIVPQAGPQEGSVIPLARVAILGALRGQCHILLDSPGVSARHARIRVTPGGYEIEDLGSKNGTIVDGSRIAPGLWVGLRDGAEVKLGDLPLMFKCLFP